MTSTDPTTSRGLTAMVLPELRALAGELGIKGTSGMRKGDLIAAISERTSSRPPVTRPVQAAASNGSTNGTAPAASPVSEPTSAPAAAPAVAAASTETPQAANPPAANPQAENPQASARARVESALDSIESGTGGDTRRNRNRNRSGDNAADGSDNSAETGDGQRGDNNQRGDNRNENRSGDNRNDNRGDSNRNGDNRDNNRGNDNRGNNNRGENNRNNDNRNNDNRGDGPDDGDGTRGRRNRRLRERRNNRGRNNNDGEPQISEDDVLQPVAGILDVLDNYAFVRTSGYLAGPNDVYVSMNVVRKNGLRRGDAITGAVRVPKESGGDGNSNGNQRQKFNPLVRLDTVNGGDVEAAKKRPDFNKLTPLYPNQRLRLETTPDRLTTRVIDLIMPIGKGQRALIASPPKAGKTTIMQDIANAIAVNNPECYLMVVLVDERPEEVTDMQRSVKGEVIASTFDRPPTDHTAVAELAIERAKRLVENGRDVVVLLDSITRLGRAYNNASPASGRILSGGVDSTALYPPKRFLGAARNIENGGSLTIIATAMVETGSTGDTVIFEEFKGTGNAELKLDRKIAERRVFPAVDVNPSSTRKDELLLSKQEFQVVYKLRRLLSGLDSHAAIDLLMSQLKKTKSNVEFLMQIQATAPGTIPDED